MRLDTLVSYLDQYLRVAEEGADPPEALNGLQVTNSGEVSRVAAAVDLCAATIRLAAEQRADLLLVHHGLFWGGLRPLVGPNYERVAGLVRGNMALYSAHLPLDRHPDVGNNAVLARQLGVTIRGEFGSYHGAPVGVGGGLIPQAAAAGLDTYITGEGQHWTFFDAEELHLNVIYAGHYATETVGVKALAEHISKKFDLPWVFLDHPTGL